MPESRQRRATPIQAFLIPSGGGTIRPHEWASREPHAVWYGLPEEDEYPHPAGGTYRRCKVEAFNGNEESLGYLPLPARYASSWVQLCYSIVYWMAEWKAWVRELGEPARVPRQPSGFVATCTNNTGARFLKYLTARRLIIDELLVHEMSKDGSDELLVFDEFIIRDRFDWLWTEYNDVPERDLEYLGMSPVHASNEGIFSYENPKLLIDKDMLAPPMQPANTWIWGKINHFDHQASFDQTFRHSLRFYRSKRLRSWAEDAPYSPDAHGLPDRWHESHEPRIRFLTEVENVRFGHPRASLNVAGEQECPAGSTQANHSDGPSGPVRPPAPAQGALPAGSSGSPGTYPGVIDNARTRAIVTASLRRVGGISLAEAHTQLAATLGNHYNAERWGKLLDGVRSGPGEEPRFSIDEAFELYGADPVGTVEMDGRARNLRDYRSMNKALIS